MQNENPINQNYRIHRHPIASGWLIRQRLPDGTKTEKFLQIGTGQWCPSQYATRFPMQRTAMVYANEFGYSVGYTAEIVPYRQVGDED